jgi:hypothetical protein
MRLIDADKFILALMDAALSSVDEDTILDLVDSVPTVDAVPVVRCKDCKYWQGNNDDYPHEECRWGHGETPDADDFCSYGERKDGDAADVQRAKDTATADACRVTLAIFFTALLDKEGMGAEQLQRIWREVEALSESVRDGYVSAPDLIRVLREEYEIDIVGG